MTKLNVTALSSDAAFKKDRESIFKAVTKAQNDIHRHLYAIAFRWNETGDVRPAVERVNALIDGMPKGVRVNAIRSWVEGMLGFIYVDKEGDKPAHFVAGKVKAKALPMDEIANTRWYEFKAEAPFKPMNLTDDLMALIEKASKRGREAKDGDVIDLALVDKVRTLIAQHKHEAAQA